MSGHHLDVGVRAPPWCELHSTRADRGGLVHGCPHHPHRLLWILSSKDGGPGNNHIGALSSSILDRLAINATIHLDEQRRIFVAQHPALVGRLGHVLLPSKAWSHRHHEHHVHQPGVDVREQQRHIRLWLQREPDVHVRGAHGLAQRAHLGVRRVGKQRRRAAFHSGLDVEGEHVGTCGRKVCDPLLGVADHKMAVKHGRRVLA
mmetsp:Transcript_32226/g.96214  ORF Transcript_32226/g.96214 Transcript_32226/m.96214 type:complete len:204 (-) Transcript_32226:291-902(-)